MKQIHFIIFFLSIVVNCQETPPPPHLQNQNLRHNELDIPQDENTKNSLKNQNIPPTNNPTLTNKQLFEEQARINQENKQNLRRRTARSRKFRNNYQLVIGYEIIMLYVIALLGTIGLLYLTVLCYKKHKRQQKERMAEEINKKYFKNQTQINQNNVGAILPTFCPTNNNHYCDRGSFEQNKSQIIQSPYFGKAH